MNRESSSIFPQTCDDKLARFAKNQHQITTTGTNHQLATPHSHVHHGIRHCFLTHSSRGAPQQHPARAGRRPRYLDHRGASPFRPLRPRHPIGVQAGTARRPRRVRERRTSRMAKWAFRDTRRQLRRGGQSSMPDFPRQRTHIPLGYYGHG